MGLLRWALLVVLSLVLGCGGGAPAVKVQPAQPEAMAKTVLDDIASRGELGSSVTELERQLEAMKASSPDKAAKLQADYKELVGLTKPDAIKAKAKEMLGKL